METLTSMLQFEGVPTREELYRQLIAIGLVGSTRGCHEDAEIIYGLLDGVMPESRDYRAVRSLAQALGGKSTYAIQAMTEQMATNDAEELPKVVMALCMLLADHPDGKFVLDNVLATSQDQRARDAALRLVPLVPALMKRGREVSGRVALAPA